MSPRRRRPSAEPGWLATAGGALLLVVVGFGVGLVAGAAFEEPDLLLGQLAGRGTRVALEDVELAPADAAPLEEASPSVASPPPAVARARPPAPEKPAPPRREPEPEPAPVPKPAAAPKRPPSPKPAPAATGPGFAVQVGAFAEEKAARRLLAELEAMGLGGYLAENPAAPGARWRVRVGPLPSEGEARRVASRLQSERRLPTWVLREKRR